MTLLRGAVQPPQAPHSWFAAAWRFVGVLFLILGLGLEAAAHWMHLEAQTLHQDDGKLQSKLATIAAPSASPKDRLTGLTPGMENYVQDVREVFQQADSYDMRITSAQYSHADEQTGDFQQRQVEFRVADTYPRIKALMAAVLQNAPHAYLAAANLERSDSKSSEVQAAFSIVWVYRTSRDADAIPPISDARPSSIEREMP